MKSNALAFITSLMVFFGDKNFMHDTGSHLPVGDIEQKMKLSIKDFTFSKCDHIRSFV